MKIQKIESTNVNFEKRYIPLNLSRNMMTLKNRMEQDTLILTGEDFKRVISVRSLVINGGDAVFKDGKFLARRNSKKQLVPYGQDTAMIEFDGVRIISDSNGVILDHKKPFFKSWDKIFEKANEYVRTALDNYNNAQIVEKQQEKKETLTKNGLNKAKEVLNIFESLNPFSSK